MFLQETNNTFSGLLHRMLSFQVKRLQVIFFGSLPQEELSPLNQLVCQHRNHLHFARGDSPASNGWISLKQTQKNDPG